MKLVNINKNVILDALIDIAKFKGNGDMIGYIAKINSNNKKLKNVLKTLKTKTPILYIIISPNKIPLSSRKALQNTGYTVTHKYLLSYLNNESIYYYICVNNNFKDYFDFSNDTIIINKLFMTEGIPFDVTLDLLDDIYRQATYALYYYHYPSDF